MIIPFVMFTKETKVSPLWLLIFYLFIIAGEAITSPTGTFLYSSHCPESVYCSDVYYLEIKSVYRSRT